VRADAIVSTMDPTELGTFYAVGCGDSYRAGHAAAMACESRSGLPCEPVNARRFGMYGVPSMALRPGRPVVVGASASGSTAVVAQVLRQARLRGACTVALTGKADGAVPESAEHSIVLTLADQEPSPGIRTYQATLLAMIGLAAGIGAARRAATGNALARPGGTDEFDGVAEAIAWTVDAAAGEANDSAAAWIAEGPFTQVVGAGPQLGTAMFVAAKLAEGAGIAATAQDPEEWWHVERRSHPCESPMIVIAAPGRAYEHVLDVLAAAHRLDRRVIALAGRGDHAVARHAGVVLPIAGNVAEDLSPLTFAPAAGPLAAAVAGRLGREAFDADPPDFPRALDGFREIV
jgi:glucosamine--fructose-6-phosphate aminotransferase (isomerizing)